MSKRLSELLERGLHGRNRGNTPLWQKEKRPFALCGPPQHQSGTNKAIEVAHWHKEEGEEGMSAIRVLIVDDSVVTRKVLSEALRTDPAIEVVGTAAEGRIALAKIEQLKPDLVTLDVEMPGMSGLETLAAIRKVHAKLPVIMFSTLTERGAATTLEALALGASDYATKPQSTGSLEQTRACIQLELIPKVKVLCRREQFPKPADVAKIAESYVQGRRPISGQARVDLVAIGTSTGGPNALAAVLPQIQTNFPVPIVVVQHMPALFTRLLAERLDRLSSIRIREGAEGEIIKPGEVWIAPGDFHMRVVREGREVRLALNQEPPQNSCRPAVDVLFDSVARAYGANVLAVVLTGMGADGLRGSQQIRSLGGQVIAQDEATSIVWGMPGQVAAAGLAEGVFPLEEIAAEIERRANWNRPTAKGKNEGTVWAGPAKGGLR